MKHFFLLIFEGLLEFSNCLTFCWRLQRCITNGIQCRRLSPKLAKICFAVSPISRVVSVCSKPQSNINFGSFLAIAPNALQILIKRDAISKRKRAPFIKEGAALSIYRKLSQRSMVFGSTRGIRAQLLKSYLICFDSLPLISWADCSRSLCWAMNFRRVIVFI